MEVSQHCQCTQKVLNENSGTCCESERWILYEETVGKHCRLKHCFGWKLVLLCWIFCLCWAFKSQLLPRVGWLWFGYNNRKGRQSGFRFRLKGLTRWLWGDRLPLDTGSALRKYAPYFHCTLAPNVHMNTSDTHLLPPSDKSKNCKHWTDMYLSHTHTHKEPMRLLT